MDPIVIAISVLGLLFVVTLAVALFGRRSDSKALQTRLEAFKNEPAQVTQQDEEESAFKHRTYSDIAFLSAFFGSFKGSESVATMLEQSGIPLRVGEYYMIRWGAAAVFFLAPFVFGMSLFNLVIALVLAAIGYWYPAQWVNGRRNKRMERINAQLVDLMGMVSNSLKSGYGLMQSFEFASRQIADPLGFEIRRLLRESTLGMSAAQALAALGRRLNSKDMELVLTAINIQRSVGGNLAEILDKVAFTMRERERIRGDIKTLTAQQKMTGVIIGGLPFFMFALFMVINPDYMSLLFTTFAGRLIILGGLVLEVMGYFSIKRIMAIEV
jgi:tight adherence protein B